MSCTVAKPPFFPFSHHFPHPIILSTGLLSAFLKSVGVSHTFIYMCGCIYLAMFGVTFCGLFSYFLSSFKTHTQTVEMRVIFAKQRKHKNKLLLFCSCCRLHRGVEDAGWPQKQLFSFSKRSALFRGQVVTQYI